MLNNDDFDEEDPGTWLFHWETIKQAVALANDIRRATGADPVIAPSNEDELGVYLRDAGVEAYATISPGKFDFFATAGEAKTRGNVPYELIAWLAPRFPG